jgi:electron transfer flavoprotein alpha subunit
LSGILIKEDLCTGCQVCISVCPFGAVAVDSDIAVIDLNTCTLCGACIQSCPEEAILINRDQQVSVNKDAYQGVWVFAEQREGKIRPVVYELLGVAQRLAEARHTDVSAVLMGSRLEDQVRDLYMRGADTVYLIDHLKLTHYLDDSYAGILTKLVHQYKPEIVLAGATSIGRSLIPRVATLLGTGLTADCTGLDIDPKTGYLLQTRPAFGGNIMARILCENHRPQMATVRHKVFPEALADPNRQEGELIKVKVVDSDIVSRSVIVDIVKEVEDSINITDANVVVAGGRGLQAQENFKLIAELAEVLGGTVAATRAAVDSGWIEYSRQVGQTGKTVNPKIYFAIGISGAIQHTIGMSSADFIVAINKDPAASIFKIANLGLVGNLFEIVPALTKRLKEVINN